MLGDYAIRKVAKGRGHSSNHIFPPARFNVRLQPMPTPHTSRKQLLVALTCFIVLALLALYWPLFNMTTSLTGDIPTDYFHFHWNFWWIRHALTTGHTIYDTNYVLYPYTSS